jgi:nitrite reductase/ring-hydroxylating ferredoxin subunit
MKPETPAQGAQEETMDDASPTLFDRSLDVVERRRPELAQHYMQVPLSYYTDPEIHARERELFLTQPRALLASSEIANAHDYVVRASMGRSLLFTRDADGKAHAFLNYCRHRGAEPASGCGNAKRHICPYHGWNYDSKGALVAMPLPDRNATLDYSQRGLVELPSEERHGFVWVVLTPGRPIDVAAHLGEADGLLAALGCGKLRYYSALPYEPLAANWKIAAEGSVESLHVPFVHRGSYPDATGMDMAMFDRFGPHVRFSLPTFGKDDLGRLRSLPVELRNPGETLAQVWLVSPGVLIVHVAHGVTFGDKEPGPTIGSTVMRYGWMTHDELTGEALQTRTERLARGVREDGVQWQASGRGVAFGGHDFITIGKNEKGVQLFHEGLAEATGYKGLRYVDA